MTLVPLSIIAAGLHLAAEILRTFNSLPDDIRSQIVRDILNDKAKRDAAWKQIASWAGGLFDKVDVTK